MILEDKNILLLRRHRVKLAFSLGKFILMFLFIILLLSAFYYMIVVKGIVVESVQNFNLFVMLSSVLVVNIMYFIFIFDVIAYFNNMIIIYNTSLVIMQSWILIREDVEIIDLNQITKLNIECQGLIPNLLGYGKLIIEQQKGENRPLFFISQPHLVLYHLRKKIDKINEYDKIKEFANPVGG